MNIELDRKLSFDDICLIPRKVSTVETRNSVDTSSVLVPNRMPQSIPIIASPMLDVCDGNVALLMHLNGGLGILPRFMSVEQQGEDFLKAPASACAIGIGDRDNRLDRLYDEYHCKFFCIDTANAGNINVQRAIERMSSKYNDVKFIVGNVASKEVYSWLEQFDSVVGIRTGVAGGFACRTRNTTGIFHPMASCIAECASVKTRTALIADGGIREPQDFCKAIALGADFIMIGSLIAATTNSPAKTEKINGKLYKIYRGSASYEVQQEYRDQPRYIEGTTTMLEYTGETIVDLLGRFHDGLRSSMSYCDAKTLTEYRKNVVIGVR